MYDLVLWLSLLGRSWDTRSWIKICQTRQQARCLGGGGDGEQLLGGRNEARPAGYWPLSLDFLRGNTMMLLIS